MEGDSICAYRISRASGFLPTPSHGGRLPGAALPGGRLAISTHALAWRATHIRRLESGSHIFLPTPSHGGRPPASSCAARPKSGFLPTPSHGGRQMGFKIKTVGFDNFYPRPRMEGDSKHAEVQACISAAYLKCSTRKAAASRRCADLGGRAVLFHQLSRLVLGRARCEPRGEGMCDRGSHRQSGRRKGLKTHSSKMSSWLH